MTETLNRPSRPPSMPPRRTSPADRERSALALGAGAGVWAAAVGLLCAALVLLLLWAADSRSGTGWVEVLRTAGRFWLVAHGASLELPGGRFSLTPLGLLLASAALVSRFAALAARDAVPTGLRAVTTLALAAAVPYAVLATVVALVCNGPDSSVPPVQAMLSAFVVGGLGAGAGALRPTRMWRAAWYALSPRSRRLGPAATAAAATLLGAGSLLVTGSLLLHLPRATELAGATDPGAAGGAALLLACLALAPNAVVWSAAWLAGPGFAVGVGTAVGPFGHELGPVPAVPLLAALPAGGLPEWLAVLVLAVPLLAGAVGGRMVAGRLVADGLTGPGVMTWQRVAGEAALVGPVTGAVLGVLAWWSGGAAGGERLVELGPSAWPVALAVTASVGIGAVAGALVRRSRLLSAT